MYDESVYAERALRAGARGYVMKAEAAKSVLEGIRRVLLGQTYLSEAMETKLAQRADARDEARTRAADTLSDRELQVLRCVGRGMSTHEVAEELYISPKTVEAHREHIKRKLE